MLQKCPRCRGKQWINEEAMGKINLQWEIKCPTCNGRGEFEQYIHGISVEKDAVCGYDNGSDYGFWGSANASKVDCPDCLKLMFPDKEE